ncbi:MAG: DUF6596 domain-containing protein [Myxococcota bacterium]
MLAGHQQVEATFRAEHGRVFAHLVGAFGDFDAAQDAIQEAYARALEHWVDGVPERPGAWITAVARNRVLSRRRHDGVVARTHGALAAQDEREANYDPDAQEVPDDRLRLLFTCCHPALAEPARIALTLRTVCGLSTAAIARLFLQPEATVAQRLVRAKKKIRRAGIPYEVPGASRLAERIDDVLSCVYLTFTAGYAGVEGDRFSQPELCAEAIRLSRVMVHAFPSHGEARALLALTLFVHSRRDTRLDPAGAIVTLSEQDRSRWDRAAIVEGERQLEGALGSGARGPFALQASIAALHATAATAAATDWPQIAGLYRELLRVLPGPAVAVASAIAESNAESAAVGLQALEQLVASGVVPADFDRLPAAQADLLHRAGHRQRAAEAYRDAIRGARHPSEAALLRQRLAALRD